jgi:hypothetical protein
MVIATPAHAAGIDPGTAAQQFFDLANNARAAAGVPALQWRDDVAGMAVGHSAEMAAAGSIWHGSFVSQGNLSALNASLLAENVGMGSDVQTVQDAFMNSEHHRENILDPGLNQAGFGVVVAGDGTVYITERFFGGCTQARHDSSGGGRNRSRGDGQRPAGDCAADHSRACPGTGRSGERHALPGGARHVGLVAGWWHPVRRPQRRHPGDVGGHVRCPPAGVRPQRPRGGAPPPLGLSALFALRAMHGGA